MEIKKQIQDSSALLKKNEDEQVKAYKNLVKE
jgi:hypothetical protein